MSHILEAFNAQINAELNLCKREETPIVCNLISTKEGRDKVFILIQKKVIQEKISIGQAIVSIEQEFNPNSYTE